jgi:thiamine-monophosphate kinase
MECPSPRVGLGMALRGIATSAIDISDGLLGDLGHILRQSGAGASVHTAVASKLIAACDQPVRATALFSSEKQLELVLAGGDDYELAFTAPVAARAAVAAAADASATRVTHIGSIEAEPGLRLLDADGALLQRRYASFDHFA